MEGVRQYLIGGNLPLILWIVAYYGIPSTSLCDRKEMVSYQSYVVYVVYAVIPDK